jgi:ribonuclease HI
MPNNASPNLTVHIDGGARGNPGPAGVGVVVSVDEQPVIERGFYLGETTNNVAEYTGLIRGVALAAELDPASVVFVSDSELMIKQVLGQYKVKAAHLKTLHTQAKAALAELPRWELLHVKRAMNQEADALANEAMDARGDVTR